MGRPEVPSGTVTFLFTDIEGSTKLLQELGAQAYDEALAEHRRLLREAFSHRGGIEVDTQGDAFLYAFPTAAGALQAALEGQEALASRRIRVRMGLHTGRPYVGKEGYIGEEVHLGARIAASAHGGQVVLSRDTGALLDDAFLLSDLGEHRLKDFQDPVWIYQLGSERFPPLKTISNTNLPRPASSFVGREREVSEVVSRLRNGTRLLTLSGPGGSGKTRLAIEAAAELVPEFKNGVFWVGLAPLRDPALVGETIAQTLGAKDGLREHVGEREMLLLLDNVEQVVEAAPELSELLQACPNLRLLVTSRELLRIQGEREYPVPPLASAEAVELFCERSQLEPDETISELCRRLDNLPLAVELASARSSLLSPGQILERLSQRLDLFRGGRDAEARQQTLRATIEWSYDLLSAEEQHLFARLAVFAGGCTLQAAEEVAGAELDTLQSLLDKSLVRRTGDRFWMLETIREFAGERLGASGEAGDVRQRHAEHFAALAEAADPQLRGGAEQKLWVERLSREFDNLRAAMRFGLEEAPAIALRLGGNLGFFFWNRGFLGEGRASLDAALALPDQPARLRVKVLEAAAIVAGQQDDAAAEGRYAEEALALSSELGYELGATSALRELAKAATAVGDHERAKKLYRELIQLAQRIGDRENHAVALNNLGDTALIEGRWEEALPLCAESRTIRLGLGNRWGAALALLNVAFAELRLRRFADAGRDLRQALHEGLDVGSTMVIQACIESFAALAAAQGRAHEAARLLGAAAAIRDELGASLPAAELRLHEETAAALEAALGSGSYALAVDEGRSLTPEEAAELALLLS